MRESQYIVIGGGPGGYETAAALAAKGRSVVLFEKDKLGGTCLNRGCIPTKCLCASASLLTSIRDAAAFGVDVPEVAADYGRAVARANTVMDQLRSGVESLLSNVEVVNAEAVLKGDKTVEADGQLYKAEKIIIATGSRPAFLDIPGAHLAVTSDDVLSLSTLPKRIAIIGGGVIGLEFASILNSFGCEVTVIEYCREILPQFDTEVAKRLRTILTRKGIRFLISTAATSIQPGFTVHYDTKRGKDTLECDLVVMAVGRKPVIPQGAVDAGIELDARGFISVDGMMETSVAGIYAIGDVNGRCMLAHAASAQGRRAIGENVNLDIIPSAVFTTPEAAMVGMTEQQAVDRNYDVSIGKATFAANGKAMAMGETDGVVKLVFVRQSGQLLGAHIVGPHASDLAAEAAALIFGLTTRDQIATSLVHGHPTLSEVIQSAAANAK